jgi:Transposase domain (DUF772)/Transposase DDE domain
MTAKLLTRFIFSIQRSLLPALEEEIGPLSAKDQQFVKVCELLNIQKLLTPCEWKGNGRPPESRLKMAHAFIAKALWNIPTTKALIGQLKQNPTLRRLCGWEDGPNSVPEESTFSRAFAHFADIGLCSRAHQELITIHFGKELIWHSATDSTAIEAREKAHKEPEPAPALTQEGQAESQQPTPPAETASTPKAKGKRGRPRKGEEPPPPDPTRLQRHLENTLANNTQDMPAVHCNYGCKQNSQGNKDYWKGYKLHLSTGDGGIPLAAYLSSASMHDSQAAIILEQSVAERTQAVFYQLKDSAYDAQAIRAHSEKMGSVPIIEKRSYRAPEAIPMEPDRALRYKARSSAERTNSDLKDNHGGRSLRVRGAAKVMTHLMFGILVISAEALIRLVV